VEKLIKYFKIKDYQRDEIYPHKLEIYMENYKISQKNVGKKRVFHRKVSCMWKTKKTKMWKTFRGKNGV